MSSKTPAVAFITRYLKTTGRFEVLEQIEAAPLKARERELMRDIVEGMSYKELAEKHSLTQAGVYQFKRRTFEKLHYFFVRRL